MWMVLTCVCVHKNKYYKNKQQTIFPTTWLLLRSIHLLIFPFDLFPFRFVSLRFVSFSFVSFRFILLHLSGCGKGFFFLLLFLKHLHAQYCCCYHHCCRCNDHWHFLLSFPSVQCVVSTNLTVHLLLTANAERQKTAVRKTAIAPTRLSSCHTVTLSHCHSVEPSLYTQSHFSLCDNFHSHTVTLLLKHVVLISLTFRRTTCLVCGCSQSLEPKACNTHIPITTTAKNLLIW